MTALNQQKWKNCSVPSPQRLGFLIGKNLGRDRRHLADASSSLLRPNLNQVDAPFPWRGLGIFAFWVNAWG
jgi:hypothetical protein